MSDRYRTELLLAFGIARRRGQRSSRSRA